MTLDGDVVAFVEVKTRNAGVEDGLESVTPAQRGRIRRAAEAWIHAHPGVGREFRFDVLTVDLDGRGGGRITHVPEAFYGDDGR